MASKFTHLKIESTAAPGVVLVVLNRPESLNALDAGICQELKKAFTEFRKKKDLRAIIITGEGEKAFCAGADLKQRQGISSLIWLKQHSYLEKAGKSIAASQVPIIAAVNGVAFGGGCELALMADFIVASDRAKFAQPETRLGIIPGMGGTQRLQRTVGPLLAKEMILFGRVLDSREALNWGLVNQVVPHSELISSALKWAEILSGKSPLAIREARRVMNAGANMPLEKALALEVQAYKKVITSPDRKEGLKAFFEKRSPKY
jgi:enoyl-CoA hydratase